MRLSLILFILAAGFDQIKADLQAEAEKSEIQKLDVVELGEVEGNDDWKDSDTQQKRDSGYSYKRPDRFTLTTRTRFQVGQTGNKGRVVNRFPSQINRPINKYGPPGHQSSTVAKPGNHGQLHHGQTNHAQYHGQQHGQTNHAQQHGHFNQQHSSNFDRPSNMWHQEIPNPIRNVDFAEANPIASQNNQPFGSNTANYLPPQNQKLPAYAAPHTFSAEQILQSSQTNNQHQGGNLQSQNLVQFQDQQISDAALFLSQNAHAIQQLHGAPASNQDFGPTTDEFLGNNNQFPNSNAQLQHFESTSNSPQGFPGQLPAYASGTLNPQETLEKIQSLEKDRLIVQLQRALATQAQSQSAESGGRYAQNQAGFIQNQDLLASLGQQMKIHGLTNQQNTLSFAAGSTAFNQSPFLPGTAISPSGFPLSYGLSTTTQTPASTSTTTSTTGVTTSQPPQGTKADGTTQGGTSLLRPSPSGSHPSVGFPVYGGFVPTLLPGTGFVTGVPTYGSGFFTPVQSSGSSPTHFGLPIPTDVGQKPTLGLAPSTPSTTPSPAKPSAPSSPPINAFPLPVHPVSPVATPLHPVTSLHPVAPLHPVLPPVTTSHVHPVQTPSTSVAHPTYGFHTPVVNSVFYKPIKPVYPLYYYQNVAYHLQKPVVPTHPWNYAPSYAQTKPAQIWK